MECLTISEFVVAEKQADFSAQSLSENVWNPFLNGTGVRQIYNNFAREKIAPPPVPEAAPFSNPWLLQTFSSAAGACLTYALAGKAAGVGLRSIGGKTAAGGGLAAILRSDTTAQIVGAGLFDFARFPERNETRSGNALGSLAAFSTFSAGNHWLGRSKAISNSQVYTGLSRVTVGSAGALAGLETTNFVSSLTGESHSLTMNDRLKAIVHGGFINFTLPVLSKKFSELTAETPTHSQDRVSGTGEKSDRLPGSDKSSDAIVTRPEVAPRVTPLTAEYESWMARHTAVIADDIAAKHSKLSADPLNFLRGTYYLWAKRYPAILPELQNTQKVNSVGDLHVGNFGTWKDARGRRAWGINDFDEAALLPYTNDLVRLLVSAKLLKGQSDFSIGLKEASNLVLAGYEDSLRIHGRPFLLDEHAQLAKIVKTQSSEAKDFWRHLNNQVTTVDTAAIPSQARQSMLALFPNTVSDLRFGMRQAGVGSLGRARFVAIGEEGSKPVASEAKVILPPATDFAEGKIGGASNSLSIMQAAVRAQDAAISIGDGWVTRRLSPSRIKVDLAKLKSASDERLLLYAMGFETANVHAGTPNTAARLLSDLSKRNSNWLSEAAESMTKSTEQDFKEWKREN